MQPCVAEGGQGCEGPRCSATSPAPSNSIMKWRVAGGGYDGAVYSSSEQGDPVDAFVVVKQCGERGCCQGLNKTAAPQGAANRTRQDCTPCHAMPKGSPSQPQGSTSHALACLLSSSTPQMAEPKARAARAVRAVDSFA